MDVPSQASGVQAVRAPSRCSALAEAGVGHKEGGAREASRGRDRDVRLP